MRRLLFLLPLFVACHAVPEQKATHASLSLTRPVELSETRFPFKVDDAVSLEYGETKDEVRAKGIAAAVVTYEPDREIWGSRWGLELTFVADRLVAVRRIYEPKGFWFGKHPTPPPPDDDEEWGAAPVRRDWGRRAPRWRKHRWRR